MIFPLTEKIKDASEQHHGNISVPRLPQVTYIIVTMGEVWGWYQINKRRLFFHYFFTKSHAAGVHQNRLATATLTHTHKTRVRGELYNNMVKIGLL